MLIYQYRGCYLRSRREWIEELYQFNTGYEWIFRNN